MVRRVAHKKYRWWIGWICAEVGIDYDRKYGKQILIIPWQPEVELLQKQRMSPNKKGTDLPGHEQDWTFFKVSKFFLYIFGSWSSWEFDFDCQFCACNLQWHSFAWWAWWVDGLIHRIDSPMFHKTLKWDGYDGLNASISFTSGPCIHFRAVSTKPFGWWFRHNWAVLQIYRGWS